MREKELRIALVCFGGISLAVYMHGVTKELLKLIRASRALHGIVDRSRRATSTFFNAADRSDPEYDTEQVYFDLYSTMSYRLLLDSFQTFFRTTGNRYS